MPDAVDRDLVDRYRKIRAHAQRPDDSPERANARRLLERMEHEHAGIREAAELLDDAERRAAERGRRGPKPPLNMPPGWEGWEPGKPLPDLPPDAGLGARIFWEIARKANDYLVREGVFGGPAPESPGRKKKMGRKSKMDRIFEAFDEHVEASCEMSDDGEQITITVSMSTETWDDILDDDEQALAFLGWLDAGLDDEDDEVEEEEEEEEEEAPKRRRRKKK